MFPRASYKENKDWENINNPVGMPKYDGANYYLQIDNAGNFHFFSRRPSIKGGFPDRTSQLPHLTDKSFPEFAGQVYNVELIHSGHSFSDTKQDHPAVSGILNSLPEKSIETQERTGPVRAILLNVLYPKIDTFAEKLGKMRELEKAFGKPEVLRTTSIKIGKAAIEDLVDSSKKIGGEGAIITSLTDSEEGNPRIKVKHTNTWNLRVSGVTQEYDKLGNPKESAGGLKVVDSTGREVATVGTGFSRQQRQDIWNNPKSWIGKAIQVKARTPSRHKLIAPVYNGESDGQMDKVAETLEDRLLDTLVQKYQSKGVNMQKILDNQLFQQLPLDKKIAFIEQAGSPILQKPSFSMGTVGTGAIGGTIAGAIATAMHGAMQGGFKPGAQIPGIVLGAAGGLALGGLSGLIRAYIDKNQDVDTQQTARVSGLNALIGRSGMKPIGGSPFGGNRYLTQLEGAVDTKIPSFAYFASDK